jgi:hypothetical protein
MKTRTWLVWDAEYPDEGSFEVRATSHWQAKRKLVELGLFEPGALMCAALETPEIRAARRAAR